MVGLDTTKNELVLDDKERERERRRYFRSEYDGQTSVLLHCQIYHKSIDDSLLSYHALIIFIDPTRFELFS